jgi:CheY-like chemotaxis protein
MGTPSRPVSWDSKTPIGEVMVVDPKALVRISVCKALAASGFETIPAGDGAEAVAQYQAKRDAISLVILDVAVPGAGGIEAARRIRAINPSAKIIMTGRNQEISLLDPQPDAFIAKPFRLGPFFEALQRVLRVERRQRARWTGMDAPCP